MTESSITGSAAIGGGARNVAAADRTEHSCAFISEQSIGSLLRNSGRLYRAHFGALFLTFSLPTLPFTVLQHVGDISGNAALYLFAIVVGFLVSIFAGGTITGTISDICLGNQPSVSRSYGKLLKGGLWLSLVLTSLLQWVVELMGVMLLVLPGLYLLVRLLLTPSAVVVERLSGFAALKRSWNLTSGRFWHVTGAVALLALIAVGLPIVFGGIAGGVASLVSGHEVTQSDPPFLAALLITTCVQLVAMPLFFVGIVLLYYDLRVRKEAYDITALSEDIMR